MPKCVECEKKNLLLRINSRGLCDECANNEVDELRNSITPEQGEFINIKEAIKTLEVEKRKLNNTINELKLKAQDLNVKISERSIHLFKIEEELMFQEFGLYVPTYEFTNSEEYKKKLNSIRDTQKLLIKASNAVLGNMNWTVNNSASQGKKMVSDMQKLLLRAFNSECDELIEKVKYNNFELSKKRLAASREAISKLGTMMKISITDSYFNSKLQELVLSYEYKQMKQHEKEEQKEIKAKMREEAKLQKEIENQRRKLEKEQNHYENALSKIIEQIQANGINPELQEKKAELQNQLVEIQKSTQEVDYREANQRAGYVYIISNEGSFGKDIYKIGMTRRLEPMERVEELGDASVPFNFDVHAMIFSENAPTLENSLHKAFEKRKVNMVNSRREFFNVSLDEIKAVIKNNYDKTAEFVDIAEAPQYRESIKIRGDIIQPPLRGSSSPVVSENHKQVAPPVKLSNNIKPTTVPMPNKDTKTFIRGQKTKISTLETNQHLKIRVNTDKSQQNIFDLSCFGVDENNILINEDYFIFYNQLESKDKSIKMNIDSTNAYTSVDINLEVVPQTIHKIVMAIAIDGDITMSQMKSSSMFFCDKQSNMLAKYEFDGGEFMKEKALILCELYRKGSDWTLSIVSQGFDGGLESLLNHFGGHST